MDKFVRFLVRSIFMLMFLSLFATILTYNMYVPKPDDGEHAVANNERVHRFSPLFREGPGPDHDGPTDDKVLLWTFGAAFMLGTIPWYAFLSKKAMERRNLTRFVRAVVRLHLMIAFLGCATIMTYVATLIIIGNFFPTLDLLLFPILYSATASGFLVGAIIWYKFFRKNRAGAHLLEGSIRATLTRHQKKMLSALPSEATAITKTERDQQDVLQQKRAKRKRRLFLLALPVVGMLLDAIVPARDPGSFAALGMIAMVVLWALSLLPKFGHTLPAEKVLRGRQSEEYAGIAQTSIANLPAGDTGLFFGGICLPSHAATQHFLVVGAPGSGKTLTIQMLMKSALPKVGRGQGSRALIYDFKKDMLAVLAGMKLYNPKDSKSRVAILNPFDARSTAWDMAADITSQHSATTMASVLFPEEKNSNNPFFRDAAVALLSGVMTAFAYVAPGKWDFRDVLLALDRKESMRRLFAACPFTQSLTHKFLDINEWNSVHATVGTKTLPFASVAAAWKHATQSISLADWEAGEGILLLGSDQMAGPQVDAINRVFFQLTAQHLLNRPDDKAKGRTTWLFLDETELAKFDQEMLGLVLKGGRSKGVAVVLGFQDVQGMRGTYGEHHADSLINNCGNMAFLRLDGEKSAEWAANMIGQYEAREFNVNWSQQSSGYSSGYSEQRSQRHTVMASEFMQLSPPAFSTDKAMDGIYVTRMYGLHRLSLKPSYMLKHGLPKPDDSVPTYIPRPKQHLELLPWTRDDMRRLGIDLLSSASTPVESQPPAPQPPSPKSASRPSSLDSIRRITS